MVEKAALPVAVISDRAWRFEEASDLEVPDDTLDAFPEGSTARTTLQNAMTDAAEADRAIVEERLAAGQTLEEAEAEFLSDEYFDQWYESTKAALEAYAG